MIRAFQQRAAALGFGLALLAGLTACASKPPPEPKLEVDRVIWPAACQVEPEVSSAFSSRTTSVQP